MNRTRKLSAALAALVLAACGTVQAPTDENAAAAPGLPPGFKLSVYAEGLRGARFMAFAPDATLYVGSIGESGKVWALRDENRDGRAEKVAVFAEGLRSPHSVAWRDGWLYVGETHRVIRLRDTDGDLRSDQQEVVVPDLPPNEMHFTRTVGFGPASAEATAGKPDGGLYVSVGSSCNVCQEKDARRAAPLQRRWHQHGNLRPRAAQRRRLHLASPDGRPLGHRQRARLAGR